MKILLTLVIIAVIILAIWIIGSYLSVKNLEEPEYSLISQNNGYEIREYNPYIVAEVEVAGDQNQALNNGFRQLAGYIFGGNTKQDSSEKIAMTVPVMETESESIKMTTPVLETENSQNTRIVQFTMPSKYTIETLPTPNDNSVKLKEIGAKKMAVLKFTGYATEKRVQKYKQELLNHLERDNINFIGNLTSAQYNPPLSFPLTRRNEILVEITE